MISPRRLAPSVFEQTFRNPMGSECQSDIGAMCTLGHRSPLCFDDFHPEQARHADECTPEKLIQSDDGK